VRIDAEDAVLDQISGYKFVDPGVIEGIAAWRPVAARDDRPGSNLGSGDDG
jgi:hypothetical protein